MKTTTTECEQLRRAISQRSDKRKKLTRALRDEAATYARQRIGAGARPSAIARELGVSMPTVSRWLQRDARAALVPVHIVAEPLAACSSLEVISPRGLRIVGLDIETLCTLLARHG